MSAHTPTTDAVRRVYALAPVDLQNGGAPNTRPDYAAAQFDRWLAAHDAEVRAETLEGAAKVLDAYPSPNTEHVAAILRERAK